jgi:hypothetical protein
MLQDRVEQYMLFDLVYSNDEEHVLIGQSDEKRPIPNHSHHAIRRARSSTHEGVE